LKLVPICIILKEESLYKLFRPAGEKVSRKFGQLRRRAAKRRGAKRNEKSKL